MNNLLSALHVNRILKDGLILITHSLHGLSGRCLTNEYPYTYSFSYAFNKSFLAWHKTILVLRGNANRNLLRWTLWISRLPILRLWPNSLRMWVWKLMATLYPLRSICGKTISYVDAYDINLNPEGSICCDNCNSISICRKAWDFLYQKGNK